MANQPKPPPRPEPPKPQPKPGQPPAAQRRQPDEDDDRYEDDDDTLDRLKGRDKTGKIPGTPLTPPEGHDHREPAPGEPGGPSSGGGLEAGEPVRTIADEQRERSAELQDRGVERVKQDNDERTEDERRSTPVQGVAHRPVEPHETSRR
jgi:hypothetical protein